MSAAVAGATDAVEQTDAFPLPSLASLRSDRISVAEAAEPLSVNTRAYVRGEVGVIPGEEAARLARRMYEQPVPEYAAALIEAALHNRDPLVRTAAAASALDTTGPREEVVAVLEDSIRSRDPTTRDIARIALARVVPQHPALAGLVVRPRRVRSRGAPSRTAVLTHGTFAARARWWPPGGPFYDYLDGLAPPLHMHSKSFKWSGAYSHAARELAAEELLDWTAANQLDRPDLFGHSHGATVVNLATQRGLQLDRVVMLALPVHDAWLPDLANVVRVIDHRVRMDLVVLADRGGQRLPASFRNSPKVEEHIVGWFDHSLPREASHWQRHDLHQTL